MLLIDCKIAWLRIQIVAITWQNKISIVQQCVQMRPVYPDSINDMKLRYVMNEW